jgi:hypothetical protein
METKDLPINVGLNKAVEEVGLISHNAAMQDCYVDEVGGVNRRYGLTELCDLGTSAGVDGLFWWEAQDMVLAISNGDAFKITAADGTKAALTMTGTDLATNVRVTWADFGTAIYAANGGKIKKISTTALTDMADADAPTAVTHVAFLDKYLLSLETNTRKIWYSAVGDPDTHEGEYFSKDAQFDNVKAMAVANLEAYLLGERTMEVWHNDGTTPFSRLGQGFVQSGNVAPYSFAYCDAVSSFVWLDHERKVVYLNGRTPTALSATINKYIQGFTTVSDAQGDYMVLAGRPYYMLTFKTEDKTLVWDFVSQQWYEWGYWNSGTASYERWRGNCFCLAPAWNLSLVGDKSNGKIYKILSTAFSDAGDTIRMLDRTGHIDWGYPTKRKKCVELALRIKRTQVAGGVGDVNLTVQYRDNGETTWKTERTITISTTSSDTEYRASLYQLGSYFSRQWQFIYTNQNVACALIQAQEKFILL